ncbi:MAG: ABC transporter ATP-binding protein [Alphaproteobacteria bacterium]|nr:ABC transporter ATP-binding protein [Alphaproteobacteria bacterium]
MVYLGEELGQETGWKARQARGIAVDLCDIHLAYPSARVESRAGVHGISLSVAEGEVLALLGPSGCGKTTTLRLIAGLETPDSGTVALHGAVVSGGRKFLPAEQRRIGFMFQDFALFPHLTVAENVGFGLKRLRNGARRDRVMAMLAEVGLTEKADAYPDELSGGQKQRVALARALAPEPSVILLDEPFSGLDASLRQSLRCETVRVLKRTGTTAIMVTHDAEEAMFMADRIALLNDGVIEQVGTPGELYQHPRTPFVAGFFGEVNRFEAVVQQGSCWTPAGLVETPNLACGTAVEVLVRPDRLHVALGPAGCGRCNGGIVALKRPLGRSTLYQLDVDGFPAPLTARAGEADALAEGDQVHVSIPEGAALVFPRGASNRV